MMDVFIEITGEKKVYTEKERLLTVQLEFFFENYYMIGTGNHV